MATKVLTFGSLTELVTYAQGPNGGHGSNESRTIGNREWYGTETFEEAATLSAGWVEGVKKLERMRAQISHAGTSPRRTTVMRETGPGGLSMGRYMSGHPQPYAVFVDREDHRNGRGKIVKVYVNVSASAIVDADVIMRRGAAIVALIDVLQRAGRRVEVTAVECCKNFSNYHEFRVILKRAQDRLNLPSLVYAIAHPSMLRRIAFAAQERADPKEWDTFHGWSYGTPTTMKDIPDGAIYMDKMHGSDPTWRRAETTSEWVKEQAAKQGVILK